MIPKTILTVQPQKASLPREDTSLLLQYLRSHGRRQSALLDQLQLRVDDLFRQAGNARKLGGKSLADRMSERASTLKQVLWQVRELREVDVQALEN